MNYDRFSFSHTVAFDEKTREKKVSKRIRGGLFHLLFLVIELCLNDEKTEQKESSRCPLSLSNSNSFPRQNAYKSL